MSRCNKCGKELVPLDISFTMKLISRAAVEYTCTDCLAAAFGFTKEQMKELAERFRREGCALFRFD